MEDGIRNLGKAFIVTALVLATQLVGWQLSNSLALLGDSAHVFSDVLSIGASLSAMWLALRRPSGRRTFGFHRVEVFAALFNGVLLVLMGGLILYEALERFGTGYAISPLPMLVTALIGLAGNLYVVYHLQHEEDLNTRSAFIHAAGDALSSIGVMIGAVLIMLTGQYMIDIAISVAVAGIILFSAYRVLRASLSILLESAPYGASTDKIEKAVMSVKGVKGVHDIHVWRTCSELIFAMMHVEMENVKLAETRAVAHGIEHALNERFHISHVTIQFEPYGCSCQNQERCNVLLHKKKGHSH
ncbi:MAG: cation diffusion facilitator family transporter [Candidatus Micrarchaeota archaeon]